MGLFNGRASGLGNVGKKDVSIAIEHGTSSVPINAASAMFGSFGVVFLSSKRCIICNLNPV
ncbi:MAG: hypothetical protein Hens2KO_27120 [Henriciella sp.]